MKQSKSPNMNLSSSRARLMAATSLVFGVCLSTQVRAQLLADSSDATSESASKISGELGEVVVTAQRRNEKLQDVPISVAAFSGDQLAVAGVVSTADLPILTPGLVFGQQQQYAQPFLRGVGTVAVSPGIENPVALYVDDVYYGSVIGSVMSLSSVEQIEVDKGPQGTLFGRNATGGLIQIKTKDPSQDFGGNVDVTYGNYQTAGTNAYITGGITDSIATDLAFYLRDQGQGYGRNLLTGQEINKGRDIAARNKWLLKPAEATEIKVVLDFERSNYTSAFGPAPGTMPLGAPVYTGPKQDVNVIGQPYGVLDQWGASVQLRQGLGFSDFVSTTAFRRTNVFEQGGAALTLDPDFTSSAATREEHSQFSQEFQLLSPANSAIKWATGAFFFDSLSGWKPVQLTGGLYAPFTYIDVESNQRALSGAVYAQGTTEVLPATNLTVGVRYTYEKHTLSNGESLGFPDGTSETVPGNAEGASKTFEKPTWRLALDHRFTPDLMGYVSYNRGFKSGGFNETNLPTSTYLPETLDAYELGAKSALFEDHLQLNVAAFLYNYKNMQNAIYTDSTELIYNAASSRLYGVDIDAKQRLTHNLLLTAAIEYIHDAYMSFPDANISSPAPGGGTDYVTGSAKGNHLPLTPDATFSIGFDYTVPSAVGDFVFNATDAYNSGWFGEPDNRLHQPSYNVVNARSSWSSTDKSYSVSLWGKNLTNKDYATSLVSQSNGDYADFAAPRTYGVTLSKKF
jgi:iron complex outermembrane recepter protein